MDWSSIAGLLADNSKQPLALVGPDGRVLILNDAMERLLGWPREEVEGCSWQALVGEPGADVPRWLESALEGESRSHRAEVTTRAGHHLMVSLDLTPVGGGAQRAVLVVVEKATPARCPAEGPNGVDFDYHILATLHEFGTVTEMMWMGGTLQAVGAPCFKLLHQRSAPCEDCPALQPMTSPWPRISVRREPVDGDRVAVLTAEPADATTVRVRVRVVSDRELTAIHDAKLAALARRARLTERETSVFVHLLAGRSLEDVSMLTNLSRRTVKFHQGNILQKLGVDSRIDLIRLTGF
jgi:PAS domain S-box-containing protein